MHPASDPATHSVLNSYGLAKMRILKEGWDAKTPSLFKRFIYISHFKADYSFVEIKIGLHKVQSNKVEFLLKICIVYSWYQH